MFNIVLKAPYRMFFFFVSLFLTAIFCINQALALPSTDGIQTYQKNVHLSEEHKQKLADDISRYRNADNLWDVLRDEFSLSHYENNPLVQEKIEWFMNNQDFLLRSASRAAPYLYYIHQQVKKRHLPAELVLLPIIESGYNPFAMSNVGATGIWQLMPSTASGLGVRRDWWYDGRRDVIASTRAALNYLAYLQSFFDGNWLLAIAAYNTGEGNVLAAIRRNIRDGSDTDFWSLPVAQQTKDYVPSLLALAIIISRPDQYPIYFPPVRNAPYLAQVEIGNQMNLKLAAKLAGLNYTKIIQLNPGFTRPTTASSRGPSKIVLPIENVVQFSENFSREAPVQAPIRWVHYKVKLGDTLTSISKKFKVSTAAIRKMNHLSKYTVKHGTNLLIPNSQEAAPDILDTFEATNTVAEVAPKKASARKNESDVVVLASKPAEASGDAARLSSMNKEYILQPGDTIYVTRKKDTLDRIATHFHINKEWLKTANHLASNKIKPGKQLIIPTSMRTSGQMLAASIDKKLQPGDTIYMVRHGDTIERIAKRFKTTAAAIRLTNLMDDHPLEEGEKLIVPTHLRG